MNGFIFDENLPVIRSLPTQATIEHVTDLGERPSDTEVWEHARLHRLVIVTKDADFSKRIILSSPPPWVVHLRVGNMRRRMFVEWLERVWPGIEAAVPEHKLVNVYADSIEMIQ
jgi:predicted nuclease of predicted toxin-antitoxin system